MEGAGAPASRIRVGNGGNPAMGRDGEPRVQGRALGCRAGPQGAGEDPGVQCSLLLLPAEPPGHPARRRHPSPPQPGSQHPVSPPQSLSQGTALRVLGSPGCHLHPEGRQRGHGGLSQQSLPHRAAPKALLQPARGVPSPQHHLLPCSTAWLGCSAAPCPAPRHPSWPHSPPVAPLGSGRRPGGRSAASWRWWWSCRSPPAR